MAKRPARGSLSVNVSFAVSEGQKVPPARAYLFDRSGALIDSKPVTGKTLSFPIDPEQPHRVVVGPDLPTEDRTPADLSAELTKAKAVLRDYVPGMKERLVEFVITPNILLCWWQTCILVHGNVRKQISPGVYSPICSGVVQIFQVDLQCTLDQVASFTDAPSLWARFREALSAGLEALEQRPPIIKNPPDPAPDFRSVTQAMQFRMSSSPAPSSAKFAKAASLSEVAQTLQVLPDSAVSKYLVANKSWIWPWLCWFIPDEWFCWQELGEATIQSDGSFSAEICLWCPDDFPDLYFEVVQNLGGWDHEIYDPQIACSTFYDYDGADEVVITVDDPTAVACVPDPGRPIPGNELYVWPTAIGNVDLRNINGLESAPAGAPTGQTTDGRPWGGTLALQMQFDPRLKTNSNVRYYRWSYKFDGDPNFTEIAAQVTHRYMTVTYSPLMIHLNPVVLGPKTVGGSTNLFDVPDPYPGDGWVDINDPWDRPFAYFDSTGNNLSPFTYIDTPNPPRRSGMCTLMLEMFDGAGNLVPCSNLGGPGPFKFVLPDLGTPNQYTSVLTANNVTPQGQLVFRVLVDNNDTVAALTSVDTPSGTADICGILHYTNLADVVAIHYQATHPNDYLNWWLSVSRGLVGVVASTSGSTSSPPNPPGHFDNTVGSLLGGCSNAAFAVSLDVDATATDGYGRQSQYDRDAMIAFALVTPCPPVS